MPLPALFRHALPPAGDRRADVPGVLPPLVKAALCQAGVVGTFLTSMRGRRRSWTPGSTEIAADLAAYRAAQPQAVVAPHGVNLVVHRS